ncbi:MAG: GAF domain-containing protein [Chloroflexota bacterium]
MRNLQNRLFPLDIYLDPIERYRAAGTYISACAILFVVIVGTLNSWGLANADIARSMALNNLLVFTTLILPVLTLLAILLTRVRRRFVGALLIIIGWLLPSWYITQVAASNFDVALGTMTIMIGILLSALLIGERSVLYNTVITIPVLVVSTINGIQTGVSPAAVQAAIMFVFGLLVLVFAAITYSLARGLPRVARQVVASSNERRLKLAEASNIITQRLLATRLDLDALLKETVILVLGASPEVHAVQIFMVDKDRRNATLVTSSHPKSTLGDQVGIGSLSVIGRVTITGQTIVVRDTNEDRPYRRAAFLDGTHAELALPLRVGGETIGVLDVQSQTSNAFPPEEVKTLETLANQIAAVVDNARLYAEAQSQLIQNKRLFEQARNSLREIERLNQQLTGGAWAEYLRSQPLTPAYTIDLSSGQVEDVAEWTPTMAEASRRNQVTIRQTTQFKVVSLPISVRGQAIGAMEFEIAPDQDIAPDQLAVLQQVIERLGFAAENTRLFEETQRIAQREALVNEISARMQVTTNVEAVIAAATQSLADAFQAPRVAIRLGTPDGAQLS